MKQKFEELPDHERLERISAAVKACHNLIKTCLGEDNPDRNFDYFEVVLNLTINALVAASRLSGEISEEVAITFFNQVTSRIGSAKNMQQNKLNG